MSASFLNASETRKILPKKHLGQNFLIDPNITRKIVAACDLNTEDVVLEIGPGKGVLTQAIAPHVKRLIAVEADRELAAALKKHFTGTNVTILENDVLRLNFAGIPQNIKVIANLPYYISSSIIMLILAQRARITQSFLTLQREFAQRLCAKTNSKNYGALSCFVQYYAEPKILFKISHSCFHPVPKVQSCFLKLDIRRRPVYAVKDEEFLFRLIRQTFQQRRKTVLNALAVLYPKSRLETILNEINIRPNCRPENLHLQEFVRLADRLQEEMMADEKK